MHALQYEFIVVTAKLRHAAFHWGRELVFTRSGNWWSPSWASKHWIYPNSFLPEYAYEL